MTDVPAPTKARTKIHQGQTYRETHTVPDDGTDFDITGWATRAKLRRDYSQSVIATPTVWVSNGPLREITVEFTASATASIVEGGVMDVEAESPLGEVRRAVYVSVGFHPEATYS